MKTREKILEELLDLAISLFPDLHWVRKSPQVDILEAASDKIAENENIADYVKSCNSLRRILSISKNTLYKDTLSSSLGITSLELERLLKGDIENLASLYGFNRKEETRAKGLFKLSFSTPSYVVIPATTKIFSTEVGLEYELAEGVSGVPFPEKGEYVHKVICRCTTSGSEGNIREGIVFTLKDYTGVTAPDLYLVTNLHSIENGVDSESDDVFVDRIEEVGIGRMAGTISFLKNLMLEDTRVYDTFVLTVDDDKFGREYGADVYIMAKEEIYTRRDVIREEKQYFKHNPIADIEDPSLRILNLDLTDTGKTATLKRIGFDESLYWRSVLSPEFFNIDVPLSEVKGLLIEYRVDQTTIDLQTKIENREYFILGGRTNVLVKKAIPTRLFFSCKVVLYGEITAQGPDVVDRVGERIIDDILILFNGGTTSYGVSFKRKLLKANVDRSDILDVILDESEVDRVDIESVLFKREVEYPERGDFRAPDEPERISLLSYEYFKIERGDIDLIIS